MKNVQKPKYDAIGIDYDGTRKADPYLTGRLLSLLDPKPNGRYLDVGCGTGNYTCEFHKNGYNFIGLDPSDRMLNEARKKNQDIDWRKGTAEETGLANELVDGITASLTIHHWSDLERGFKELYRVLKPGGNLVVFTTTPEQTARYWLRHYFPVMIRKSAVQIPSLELVKRALDNAGFGPITMENYLVQPDLKDLFLYSGKYNPELYFNENVRSGISSFSALADPNEVTDGLEKLREDITSGIIDEVISGTESDEGDYLFIKTDKSQVS